MIDNHTAIPLSEEHVPDHKYVKIYDAVTRTFVPMPIEKYIAINKHILFSLFTVLCILIFGISFVLCFAFPTYGDDMKQSIDINNFDALTVKCDYVGKYMQTTLENQVMVWSFNLYYNNSNQTLVHDVFNLCPIKSYSSDWYIIKHVDTFDLCRLVNDRMDSYNNYIIDSTTSKFNKFETGVSECSIDKTNLKNYCFCTTDNDYCISNGIRYQQGNVIFTPYLLIPISVCIIAIISIIVLISKDDYSQPLIFLHTEQ
jgi:hypothetical protein